jgi:hypothetical protein
VRCSYHAAAGWRVEAGHGADDVAVVRACLRANQVLDLMCACVRDGEQKTHE